MEQSLVLFSLYREQDQSGVSGTGTVAYGIKFPEPNGRVVLGWVPAHDRTSVAVYDSMDVVKNVHGHGGSTKLIQLDKIDCGGPQ
jgi:hypothetical protein